MLFRSSREMNHTFPLIARDFKSIPVTRVPKVKVGVVGEIYVKYSPLGNNDLQKFLESQNCEVNFPGLMGFVQYCIFNMGEDHVLYGGKLAMKMGTDQLLNWLDSVERSMLKAEADAGFYAPGPFKELVEKPEGIISLGAKMGEGWLLTAEMIELVQGGYGNIVCAQPFGCLPNHIVGKGMVNKIRAMYPSANITPHRLRPQRHQSQSGEPHQTDAGRSKGASERSCRGEAPDRRGDRGRCAQPVPRLRNYRRNKEAARYSFSLYCAAFLMRRSAYFL